MTLDWNLLDNPAPLINMASRSIMRLGDRQMRPLGLAVAQLPVLYLLQDGGAMPQKELALRAKVEQPSMAQVLSRMERDGLIHRSPDPNDRRSCLISLTDLAMSRIEQAREDLKAANAAAFEDFSDAEIGTLVALLSKLNVKLDNLVTAE